MNNESINNLLEGRFRANGFSLTDNMSKAIAVEAENLQVPKSAIVQQAIIEYFRARYGR